MKNKCKELCRRWLAGWRRRADFRKRVHFINKAIKKYENELPALSAEQVKEIEQYWARYGFEKVPLQWHRFYYGKTGQFRPDFIPAPFFYESIKPAMNDVSNGAAWSDKSYLDFFLRDIATVRTVLRNVNGRWLDESFGLLSAEEAQRVLDSWDTLVVKPSMDTNTGKGVALLHKPFRLDEIAKNYRRNFVFQLPLKQHPTMAALNESSINTIRVNSVLLENKAYVMSAFVKVGQAGEFADNRGHDRFFIGIGADGSFVNYAIDHDLKKYSAIPSGFAFAGQAVPSYQKVCRLVETAHQRVAHFGFAFWDVCVREDGEPVIVEMNLKNPDSTIPQVCSGPLFGAYSDQVLSFCTSKCGKE